MPLTKPGWPLASDEGQPAQPHYGDRYYGDYLRDPDGNKLHVVFRGDIAGQD